MSHTRKFLLDAASNYLRMLTVIACALVLTRAMAIHLGMDDFGRWSLITSILGIGLVLDMGLGNVAVKTAGATSNDRDPSSILSAIFVTFLVLSAVALFASIAVALWLLPDSRSVLVPTTILLAARFTIASLPWSVYRSVLFARGGMVASNLIQAGTAVAYSIAAYVALHHQAGLVTLAFLTLVSAVAENGLMVLVVYRVYPDIKIGLKFSLPILKPALSLGGASLLVNFAGLILLKTDPIIVKTFMPFSQVALYAVALRIAENLFLLCKQLVNALTPHALRAAATGQAGVLGRLYQKVTRYVFAFAVALYLCCLVMGTPAIRLWLSDDFAPSAAVLNILLAAMVLSVPQLVASNLMTFSGHHRVVAKLVVSGAVINVIASVVLVRLIGMNGVALGTLTATIMVDLLALIPLASKSFGLPWRGILLPLGRAVGLPGLVQLALLLAIRHFLPINSIFMIALYCLASLFVFGMVFLYTTIEPEERAVLLEQIFSRQKNQGLRVAGEAV